MNENDWSALLEQGAERVPVADVPVDAIVTGAGRRRSRRRQTVGAVAAVALAAVGTVAWHQGWPAEMEDGRLVAEAPVEAGVDTPPAGKRWVGLGRIAVAVPEEWGFNDTHCGVPQSDTAVVWDGPVRLCLPTRPPGVESIEITESSRGHIPPEMRRTREITIDGARAQRSEPHCAESLDAPVCTVRVEFPDDGVTVLAESNSGADAAAALLEGLHVLEVGVGVPDHSSWSSDLQARAAEEFTQHLRERGFVVDTVTDRGTGAVPGYVLGVSPSPGTVVSPGTTVTVTVAADGASGDTSGGN